MLTLSMPSPNTGSAAVQQEIVNLNQSLTDSLAVIEEFMQSQLDVTTLSNELSQEFTAWDMPTQFEDLKAILNLSALSTLEGVTTLVGETIAAQNELLAVTLLTIAELFNTYMSALLLTETMLGANNSALFTENNLYLSAIVEAVALADINNLAAISTASERQSAENAVLFAALQDSMTLGFQGTFANQNAVLSLMRSWFSDTANKLSTQILYQHYTFNMLSLVCDSLSLLRFNLSLTCDTLSKAIETATEDIINTNQEIFDAQAVFSNDIITGIDRINTTLDSILAQLEDDSLAQTANDLTRRGNDLSETGNELTRAGNLVALGSYVIAVQSLAVQTFDAVTPFASGGFPTIGQMFIAREAGPELVGTIGGRSAVANNNQIVESVSSGVARAVAGVLGSGRGGQNVQVFIGNDQLDSYIVKSQRRQALRTNGGRG